MQQVSVGQVWRLNGFGEEVRVTKIGKSDRTVFYTWEHKGQMNYGCSSMGNWYDLFEFVGEGAMQVVKQDDAQVSAADICKQAIETMAERGKTYDKSQGRERSMGKTVAAFNALTGHKLTEEQGWLFMAVLKMARAQQGEYKHDNYLDGTAYFSLAGEAAANERI